MHVDGGTGLLKILPKVTGNELVKKRGDIERFMALICCKPEVKIKVSPV